MAVKKCDKCVVENGEYGFLLPGSVTFLLCGDCAAIVLRGLFRDFSMREAEDFIKDYKIMTEVIG